MPRKKGDSEIKKIVLKRNVHSSHRKKWKRLKCILLHERSQSRKATYYKIPNTWHSGKGKKYRDSKEIGGCQGLREGRDEKQKMENF